MEIGLTISFQILELSALIATPKQRPTALGTEIKVLDNVNARVYFGLIAARRATVASQLSGY